MRMRWLSAGGCGALLLLSALAARADVVLHGTDALEVSAGGNDENLWVTPDQLARISGFHVKAEGLCLDEFCVPVPPAEKSELMDQSGADTRVNIAALARRVQQPYALDAEQRVWSFGPVPVTQRPFLEKALAPDVELVDVKGERHRISDFRGKKVVLVAWASWCECREDLPIWEKLYQELHAKGLEIVTVAEDSEGVTAASPFIDAAKATHTALVDPLHAVTAAFHLVNVPTAVWIDEQGTIVRLDSGAYPEQRSVLGMELGAAGYSDALRDWVERGAQSRFALSPEELVASLKRPSLDTEIADQEFRLGVYFHDQGDGDRATAHWERAADLAPDNWNYRRQEWSDSMFESTVKLLTRAFGRSMQGVPYYDPIVLERPSAAAEKAQASTPAPR
jgi:peroxiredoxin